MAERFASLAGYVTISYDEKSATAHVFMHFRTWGASYEMERVSSTADAIQRVRERLEYKPEAVAIVGQIDAWLGTKKQGDLFAQEE